MSRERAEHQNAMNGIVFVYFINDCQKFLFGYIFRQKNFLYFHTKGITSLGCTGLIRNIVRSLSDTDNAKLRGYSFLC